MIMNTKSHQWQRSLLSSVVSTSNGHLSEAIEFLSWIQSANAHTAHIVDFSVFFVVNCFLEMFKSSVVDMIANLGTEELDSPVCFFVLKALLLCARLLKIRVGTLEVSRRD